MKKKGVKYVYLKGASVTTNLRQKYLRSQTMWTEENIRAFTFKFFCSWNVYQKVGDIMKGKVILFIVEGPSDHSALIPYIQEKTKKVWK